MSRNHSNKKSSRNVNQDRREGDILWPRRVALNILERFWNGDTFLDALFDTHSDFAKLDSRNRNFVRMLVTTAIRRNGQVEDIMRRGFAKPDQKVSPDIVRYILHLGITQIVFMNVADHAAVNTSVDLAVKCGAKRAKGFINAVLRRAVENGKQWTTEQDIPRLNTPKWLLDIWSKDYGKAEAVEIAQASLSEAPLDFTVKDPIDRDHWAEALGAQTLPTGTLRRNENALVSELSGFNEGAWWIQDAAAALPVRLLGDTLNKTVVDLCAAPGGKTLQLASNGAKVFAVDRSAKRMKRLEENIKRVGVEQHVQCEVADSTLWQPPEPLDIVLLDAPCTATGTIRRNPDAPWLKSAQDIDSMIHIQRDILNNAVKMIKPGGTLLYCTCSLQKDEGERQVMDFLQNHNDFSVQAIEAEDVPGLEKGITQDGFLRILPYYLAAHGGIDGFFIARLKKSGV